MSDQVIDLFSGVGGFSLGAHLAGLRTALAIELDADLSYSYKSNFPSTPLLREDMSRVSVEAIRKRLSPQKNCIAGVIGGPPCQGFSLIGRRDPEDERNNLVADFFRVVKAIGPKFFVFENVPGILSAPYSLLLSLELEGVSDHYDVTGPLVLDAADFGAPTKRRRAIVVGTKKDCVKPFSQASLPVPVTAAVTVAEAFEGLPSSDSTVGEDCRRYVRAEGDDSFGGYARWAMTGPSKHLSCRESRRRFKKGIVSGFQETIHSARVRERFSLVAPGETDTVSRYPRLQWDQPAPTLRAGTGRERGSFQAARPIHPTEDRVITVREAARIQGFPDWFVFHPTKWHSFRMIGNSVSPIFAKSLLATLKNHLTG